MTEYERFGLVFTKTRVYKFEHWDQNPKSAGPERFGSGALILKPGFKRIVMGDGFLA